MNWTGPFPVHEEGVPVFEKVFKMSTKLLYLETGNHEGKSTILSHSKDELGFYIVLDQTLFYPQGGGQPSDSGSIEASTHERISVQKVKWVNGEVRHYVDRDCTDIAGQTIQCHIDPHGRAFHSKLHTSGHLISNLVEKSYPNWRAVKGHHFPKECYVEFKCKIGQERDLSAESLNNEVKQFLETPVFTQSDQVSPGALKTLCPEIHFEAPDNQPIRVVRIGDFSFSPCGGTHVESTKELQGLIITKTRVKKNTLKVFYDLI